MQYNGPLVRRDRVCAAEIWRECLGERKAIPRQDAARINAVLSKMKGWRRAGVIRIGANYGSQKGFVRE